MSCPIFYLKQLEYIFCHLLNSPAVCKELREVLTISMHKTNFAHNIFFPIFLLKFMALHISFKIISAKIAIDEMDANNKFFIIIFTFL